MPNIKCPKCGETFAIDNDYYLDIVSQIKNEEFNKEVKEKIDSELEKNNLLKEKETTEKLNLKDSIIKDLENKIKSFNDNSSLLVEKAKLEIEQNFKDEISKKDLAIANLKTSYEKQISDIDKEHLLNVENLKKDFDESLKAKDLNIKDIQSELERVKEHKLSLSTKAIGEDLEQYCKNEFEKLRAVAYRNSYFEKDNEVKEGTKGDFIFRDFENDVEFISIMFEMKNENDATESKHKNEDFFKKLDSDRKKKNCEYAVLVSMLEQDNDLYNKGITEVCQYEKMYVVRPQNFMDIISLLRNMARSSLKDKMALIEKERADIDLTNFSNNVASVIQQSGVHYKNAINQHENAIKEINDAIKKLEEARDALMLSNRHMDRFTSKIDELTDIKKLANNSPSIIEQIENK